MSGISLNLEKGVSLNLSKEFNGIKNINVGLGWQTHMDLDAFAIMLDCNNKVLGVTYYRANELGVILSGDDLEGGKTGDCETLFIKTDSLNKKVKKICLFANIYSAGKHTFSDVQDSYIRLIDADTNEELLKYDLKDTTRNYNAIYFADLDVTDEGLIFKTIGKGLNGSVTEIRNMIISGRLDINNSSERSTTSSERELYDEKIDESPQHKNFLSKLFKR